MPSLDSIIPAIASRAQHHDLTTHWPADDLTDLASAGAMRWALPKSVGGDDLSPLDLHLRYEQLATASLATALILTQHDSAAALIAASSNPQSPQLLSNLAHNKIFSTVGIAQLTTSRQGATPALRATPTNTGYTLTGSIPWCTGAAYANPIVAGATLPNTNQLLFLLNPRHPSVKVHPPLPLVALRSTHTTTLDLHDLPLTPDQILAGPAPAVLGIRKNNLPLGQTFLALGLARSALNLIAAHRSESAQQTHQKLNNQLNDLRSQILTLSRPGHAQPAAQSTPHLRGAINDLTLRCAHAAVTLYKGAALLQDHPAQRLARESLFLLVWSCPNPVIDCTLDRLSAD